MKLSDAIRFGAMMRPQRTDGNWLRADGSCALGAAAEAVGAVCATSADEEQALYDNILSKHWPWLASKRVEDPLVRGVRGFVGLAIMRLNDSARWTRERIAEWVATVEPEEVPDGEDDRSRDAQQLVDALCG